MSIERRRRKTRFRAVGIETYVRASLGFVDEDESFGIHKHTRRMHVCQITRSTYLSIGISVARVPMTRHIASPGDDSAAFPALYHFHARSVDSEGRRLTWR